MDAEETVKTLHPVILDNEKIREYAKKAQQAIDEVNEYINVSNADLIEAEIKQLAATNKLISEKTERIRSQHSDVETIYKISQWMHDSILSRKGPVASRLTSMSCQLLEDEMNSLSPSIDTFCVKVLPGTNIDIVASFRRKKGVALSEMSGGERKLTDIFILVALNNLFSKKYRLAYGVLGVTILDEVFGKLDDLYLDLGYEAVHQCNSSLRIVIDHSTRLQSFFKNTIHADIDADGNSVYAIR